ncbi:MAG: hypothetical protein K1X88_33480 [Nannocystaceae bacterium]|nr:hypothetical protein [Nannocystaceae bacterium]
MAAAASLESSADRLADWLSLRDTAAAAQLAVQLLAGPLSPTSEPPPDPTQLREVLAALDRETRRICALVAKLQPAANDPPPAVAPAARPARVAAPTRRAASKPAPAGGIAVDELLRALELELLGRGELAPRLSIVATPRLHATTGGPALVAALAGLVLDAAALGPADATVQLRVFTDLAEDLGDALHVVFEVRPDPRTPSPAWPTVPSAPPDAALTVGRRGGVPFAQLRIGHAR